MSSFWKDLFSLDTFKSEKKKEQEQIRKLQEEVAELKQKIDKTVEQKAVATVATVVEKQYLSLHYDGHNLTVVDLEGNPYTKEGATKDDIKAVKNAETHEELLKVFKPLEEFKKVEDDYATEEEKEINALREEVKVDEVKKVKTGFPLLSESGEFDVEDNVVYFKGIRRSLPKLLVAKFSKIIARVREEQGGQIPDGLDGLADVSTKEFNIALNEDLEFLAHKRFTYWCFLAPYPEVLDKLYPFLEAHGLKLTKEGFFLAIRNVVTVAGTKNGYADAVTNFFTKIKTVWKKSPKNFELWENNSVYALKDLKKGKFMGIENEEGFVLVGSLQDLNDNIKDNDDVRYTDNYTKTFDIRLNKWVTTDPKNIVWASRDCVGTGGLHFSLDSTGLCGDKSLLIAVNPMHVTSVGTYKATSWAYFPFMATETYEARKLLLDQDFESFNLDFEKFDEKFNDLEELAKEGFKEHSKVEKFDDPNLPKGVLNETEIELVTKSLEEMKNELDKRIVEV